VTGDFSYERTWHRQLCDLTIVKKKRVKGREKRGQGGEETRRKRKTREDRRLMRRRRRKMWRLEVRKGKRMRPKGRG